MFQKWVRKLLPQATIVLSNMFIVFFIFDKFNPAMGFINNNISKTLLLIFCILSTLSCILLIASDRKKERDRARRKKPPVFTYTEE